MRPVHHPDPCAAELADRFLQIAGPEGEMVEPFAHVVFRVERAALLVPLRDEDSGPRRRHRDDIHAVGVEGHVAPDLGNRRIGVVVVPDGGR